MKEENLSFLQQRLKFSMMENLEEELQNRGKKKKKARGGNSTKLKLHINDG